MASRDNVTIAKMNEPTKPTAAPHGDPDGSDAILKWQSDTGANVCATNLLELLVNVVWIEPASVNTAQNAAPMTAKAIGQLPVAAEGNVRYANCYYIPEASGTIISPTALIRQFGADFIGFKKECYNIDTNAGSITLLGRDGKPDWTLPLICENDLWWHSEERRGSHGSSIRSMNISHLSDAAKYELWHHRLCHRGKYVTDNIHNHATGVPKLRGNSFYRCPSCMSSKCHKRSTHPKHQMGSTVEKLPAPHPAGAPDAAPSDDTNIDEPDLESFLDEVYMKDAQPGQHFHIDLGFVRGSDFVREDESKRTVTSIDGKRCYYLIVDRATRYMWVYTSASKDPPIEAVQAVLSKFKSTHTHRTVRTDQDKSLGKSAKFKAMVEAEKFTLELTGSDNSKQNSPAERPHRDLGEMMRCVLHSADLGSEYWSFALPHAVYVKNRVPHASLKMSPFQALTGTKPSLSHLRIFGSIVYAKNPGERSKKLDHNTSRGIFLGFSATAGNIYYHDLATGNIKIGTHVFFDEAHMTSTARRAPLAAEALQRLGYHVRESWIDTHVKTEHQADIQHSLLFERLTPTAIIPKRATEQSIGFDLYCDVDEITIPPNAGINLIPTGIAAKAPSGTYLRIAPRSGLTVKRNLHTLAGVVDPDYTGNVTVVMQNFGSSDQLFKRGDKIAQLIVEHASMPKVEVIDKLPTTQRSASGFGSTDKLKNPAVPPTPTPTPPAAPTVPMAAAAASLEMNTDDIIRGLHMELDMPYDIHLSDDMFDNLTTREIALRGNHPTLGLDMKICDKHGLPQLRNCLKSTPAGRIQRWRSELRRSYVTAINGVPVKSIEEVTARIKELRSDVNNKDVTVQFATMEKIAMHPEKGTPQLYSDQMNIIAEHLWELSNDPVWQEGVLGSIPAIDKILEDCQRNDTDLNPTLSRLVIKALKKKTLKQKRKLTRPILQGQDDWNDWKQSEFKQLDQYRDQDTFGEPIPAPRDQNLLSLLWTYMIKDDGRKKARCVCNGSKKMRGSVTLAETYASSLEQTASRIFWAATSAYNFITIGADAANAFAEAPPPVAPLYVYCDQQYREWRKERTGEDTPRGYVMRVQKALQGHPESARLWAILIDKVISELNLQPCTHEPNLYYTSDYNNTGKKVLFLRQVDDFAIACEDTATADDIIQAINSKMTIEVKKLGLITRFNGVDITQTRDYVKISNAIYIEKILANHPWLTSDSYPVTSFPIPMHSEATYQRKLETAKPFDDQEKEKYETQLGFTYRQAIGELLFALVTCRPDISFAVVKLSQYSAKPAREHFEAIQQIYAYLRDTKDHGIHYWDENYTRENVETLEQHSDTTLTGAKDSDFAGDVSHRRSVAGVILKIAGGAVLFKSSFIKSVSLSSTEAEFHAAALAGKQILYLRTILDEIGLPQEDATVLYEDNQGALLMANAQKPTKRTRHMDTQAFALQSWVDQDLIAIKRISTSHNYSDGMTKALPRTLFYRHNDFVMGRVLPDYVRKHIQPRIQKIHIVNASVDFQSDRTCDINLLNERSWEGMTQAFVIPVGYGTK